MGELGLWVEKGEILTIPLGGIRGRSGNHSRIDPLTLVTFPVSCGDRVPGNSPGGGGSGQGGGGSQGIWWCMLVAEALHGDRLVTR